jgi:STE24 endopeptidase
VDRRLRRLSLSLVAAVAVAEAAVLLLRPRSGIVDPARVSATSYFSREEIERARAFRRPNLALFLVSSVLETAVLVALTRRPPAFLAARDRPVARAAATGAGLVTLLTAVGLPVAAILRKRSMNVGLSTQSWGGWAGDTAKATGISAALSAGAGALFVGLVRRAPRTWWLPASGAAIAFSGAFLIIGPVVLDPIFNTFKPLPEERRRRRVLELAEQAGVKVGEVFEMDASRRTTAANAYVTGIGATKRVVLFDTLLDDFTDAEVDLVVAHELGHVRHRDVPRGLLFLLAIAPVSVYAAKAAVEALMPDPEVRRTAAMVPAGALALGIVSFAITTASNQLSRAIERRADAYALTLTNAPQPFIDFERRIAIKNVADPDPPRLLTWLMGTHPPIVERIGTGVAFAERAAATRRDPGPSGGPAPGPGPRTPGGS